MRRSVTETEQLAVNQQRAAYLLDVSVATLRRWDRQGTGPEAVRRGKFVRYRRRDLERFLEDLRRPTE